MATRKCSLIAIALAALGMTLGCASENVVNERLISYRDFAKKEPNATYVVDPPDVIKVEFPADPDMTREMPVRSDGCVTLLLIEDVKVAGLTPMQIREKLEKLYAEYFKEPQILVTVTAYNSKKVFVYGEVGRRGSIPYTGTQTVVDVLGSIGGVGRRGASARVRVARGDPNDPEVYRVNLKKLLLEGDQTQNVLLSEDDVIYVPPTVLAWVGYRIDDLLFPFRSLLAAIFTSRALDQNTGVPAL